MFGFVEVLSRMFVLRRVTTANMPANQAQAQVHPRIPGFDAVFADVRFGLLDFDLIEV
jgi:hypothetical protein